MAAHPEVIIQPGVLGTYPFSAPAFTVWSGTDVSGIRWQSFIKGYINLFLWDFLENSSVVSEWDIYSTEPQNNICHQKTSTVLKVCLSK